MPNGPTPSSQAGGPGPAVDRSGNPVIDPSENVIALNEAANKRQDDLRELESTHIREILALRSAYDERLRGERTTYDEKLRLAESGRIDAIRAVDVNAVQRAAEVQATQALALQAQVATSAEAMRAQVAQAAAAAQANLTAALDPIQKDIADLRRAQYEAQGLKVGTVETRSDTAAVSNMRIAIIMAVLVGLGLFVSIAAIVVTFLLTQ